jgi:F-type H+-transporting ATPase subunit b
VSNERFYLEIAIWSQAASSVLFIGALAFIWYRWVLPTVMSAQERSNRQIAEAERHRDEVKGALDSLREEIANAQRDATLIAQRAELHAQRERESLVNEATRAGERALQEAQGELDRAREAARRRLRDDLVSQALAIARGDAAARVGPALDARLIEHFVDSLQGGAGG